MTTPVFGQGLLPQTGAVMAELSAVTRRAIVPSLFVQFYSAAPGLMMLLRNAQRTAGGVNPISIPVQGSAMTSASWASYSGGFQPPSITPGVSLAGFNNSLLLSAVGITGPESMSQSSEVVIPLLRARLADARNQMILTAGNALYGTATTDPTGQQMLGLIDAYDSGSVTATYGGIARSTNAFWAGNKITTSITPSRQTIAKQIMNITNQAGGETPDLVIMSPSDWTTLMLDYMNSETFFTTPTTRYGKDDPINAGFSALLLQNVPVLADKYCPKGVMFMVNTRYLSGYVAESANFDFSGFYSMIPNNQIANQGVLALGIQVCCAKPVSGAYFTTIAGGAF